MSEERYKAALMKMACWKFCEQTPSSEWFVDLAYKILHTDEEFYRLTNLIHEQDLKITELERKLNASDRTSNVENSNDSKNT